jgi:hypothetical protein
MQKLQTIPPIKHSESGANQLASSITQFVQDVRFIIAKVDEFELSLKLARQRPRSAPAQPLPASTEERN